MSSEKKTQEGSIPNYPSNGETQSHNSLQADVVTVFETTHGIQWTRRVGSMVPNNFSNHPVLFQQIYLHTILYL